MHHLPFHNADTVAAKMRTGFEILTALNEKTPKGEKLGYVQAILYLAPHDLAGGKTVCPHSTEACRQGCLFHAGRGKTPRVINARTRRTRLYLTNRDAFFDELIGELVEMQRVTHDHGMRFAVRLNGTSDVMWERERFEDGKTLFDLFGDARFFDYTRIPFEHRHVPAGWHLTWSVADSPIKDAVRQLRLSRNIAVVTPSKFAGIKDVIVPSVGRVHLVDGDLHDLRFLDPSPSIVLLTPKGRLKHGGPMVRENFVTDLVSVAREMVRAGV